MDLYFDECVVESARADIRSYTVKANEHLSNITNQVSREATELFRYVIDEELLKLKHSDD